MNLLSTYLLLIFLVPAPLQSSALQNSPSLCDPTRDSWEIHCGRLPSVQLWFMWADWLRWKKTKTMGKKKWRHWQEKLKAS